MDTLLAQMVFVQLKKQMPVVSAYVCANNRHLFLVCMAKE
jgi:hypothetical protein